VALNKTDKSFKTLINKRFTTPDRNFFQEIGKDTINTHMREVWMNTIPTDSASAITSGYAEYYEQFTLTADPTFNDQAFYFISGSGFTPGTDSINSGWLVNEASQSYFIGDFISDKYGSSYEVKLYDASGSQIFKTDAISWIFDYKTGVLHVADAASGSYPTPYSVTVYKYTGLTLADPGAIPSSSISGTISQWTSSADGSISHYGDVKISGSLYISGSDNRVYGTASWAESSSYSQTASVVLGTISSASHADWAISSSYATTASYALNTYWTSSIDGHIERFGDVKVSGSFYISGSDNRMYGTASWAESSSYSDRSISASFAENSLSSSYSDWSISSSFADTAISSSQASTAITASYALNAGEGGLWTGSFADGHIERVGDVIVSGSFYVAEGNGFSQINVPIIFNDYILAQSSSGVNTYSTTIYPRGTIYKDYRDEFIDTEYQIVIDDSGIVGTLYDYGLSVTTTKFNISNYTGIGTFQGLIVSGNIVLRDLDTVDGVDISEFSSSVATQINNLQTGSTLWTLNDDGTISRDSNVKISGSLYLSGSDNRLYGTASWVESSSQAVSASSTLWSISSSFAESTPTASHANWSISSSFAESTPTASHAEWSISSSFADNTLSSSFAEWTISSSFADTSITSSHALTSITASFAQTVAPGIGGLWTGSFGDGHIERFGQVNISGSLIVSGALIDILAISQSDPLGFTIPTQREDIIINFNQAVAGTHLKSASGIAITYLDILTSETEATYLTGRQIGGRNLGTGKKWWINNSDGIGQLYGLNITGSISASFGIHAVGDVTASAFFASASIDQGLSDFLVWDSGSGEFKRRSGGSDGTSGTSGTDGLPGNDGTSGTSGTSASASLGDSFWTGSYDSMSISRYSEVQISGNLKFRDGDTVDGVDVSEFYGDTDRMLFTPFDTSYVNNITTQSLVQTSTFYSHHAIGKFSDGKIIHSWEHNNASGQYCIFDATGSLSSSILTFTASAQADYQDIIVSGSKAHIFYWNQYSGGGALRDSKYVQIDSNGTILKTVQWSPSRSNALGSTLLNDGNILLLYQNTEGGLGARTEYAIINTSGSTPSECYVTKSIIDTYNSTTKHYPVTFNNGNVILIYYNSPEYYYKIIDPTGSVVKERTAVDSRVDPEGWYLYNLTATSLTNGNVVLSYALEYDTRDEWYAAIIDPTGSILIQKRTGKVTDDDEWYWDYGDVVQLENGDILTGFSYWNDGTGVTDVAYNIVDTNLNVVTSESYFRAIDSGDNIGQVLVEEFNSGSGFLFTYGNDGNDFEYAAFSSQKTFTTINYDRVGIGTTTPGADLHVWNEISASNYEGLVENIDVSDFSASVAQKLTNIETGSAVWTIEGDGSISRNSNVKVTGSFDVTVTGSFGYLSVDGGTF